MEVWRREIRGMGMGVLQQNMERRGMAREVEGRDDSANNEKRGGKGIGGL